MNANFTVTTTSGIEAGTATARTSIETERHYSTPGNLVGISALFAGEVPVMEALFWLMWRSLTKYEQLTLDTDHADSLFLDWLPTVVSYQWEGGEEVEALTPFTVVTADGTYSGATDALATVEVERRFSSPGRRVGITDLFVTTPMIEALHWIMWRSLGKEDPKFGDTDAEFLDWAETVHIVAFDEDTAAAVVS